MCAVVAFKPEMNTNPPTLTELLAEQAKDVLCREVAASFGMLAHVSCMTVT